MTEGDPDPQDAQFDAMLEQEAARPDLAPPPVDDDPLTPGEMLQATVESAKADAAAAPEKPARPAPVQFTAEEFLATRERLQAAERERDEARKATAPKKDEKPRPGLFESPEEWEAELERRIEERASAVESRLRTDALNYDLAQTQARVGDEKWAAMDKAVSEAAARDPQFAAQLRSLSPYGAGAAIEKWYDSTEAVRDPSGYEKRLREKWEAERTAADAPNTAPAGQRPATGADAAGSNVTRLPPSLSRQAASRAAVSGDDGDDSEAAIFAAGANPRRA